jgi:8-oxo-dGTP diphosphatase
MNISLLTQVYALRAGRVLLLKRAQAPNLGLWVAPGEKVHQGESLFEAALREFQEKTGLKATKLVFRAIVTLVAQDSMETSNHFLYVCNEFSGEIKAEHEEGQLSWQHLHRVFKLPMPPADQHFMPHVINLNLPIYQAKYVSDEEGNLVEIVKHESR